MKTTLVTALSDYVGHNGRRKTRQFLQGLSADELRYIAEFLGSCILESPSYAECTRGKLAEIIEEFEHSRSESGFGECACLEANEHKMILLMEYLCRCQSSASPRVARAGQG